MSTLAQTEFLNIALECKIPLGNLTLTAADLIYNSCSALILHFLYLRLKTSEAFLHAFLFIFEGFNSALVGFKFVA